MCSTTAGTLTQLSGSTLMPENHCDLIDRSGGTSANNNEQLTTMAINAVNIMQTGPGFIAARKFI